MQGSRLVPSLQICSKGPLELVAQYIDIASFSTLVKFTFPNSFESSSLPAALVLSAVASPAAVHDSVSQLQYHQTSHTAAPTVGKLQHSAGCQLSRAMHTAFRLGGAVDQQSKQLSSLHASGLHCARTPAPPLSVLPAVGRMHRGISAGQDNTGHTAANQQLSTHAKVPVSLYISCTQTTGQSLLCIKSTHRAGSCASTPEMCATAGSADIGLLGLAACCFAYPRIGANADSGLSPADLFPV